MWRLLKAVGKRGFHTGRVRTSGCSSLVMCPDAIAPMKNTMGASSGSCMAKWLGLYSVPSTERPATIGQVKEIIQRKQNTRGGGIVRQLHGEVVRVVQRAIDE